MKNKCNTVINLIITMLASIIPILLIYTLIHNIKNTGIIERLLDFDIRQQILTTYTLRGVNPYQIKTFKGLENVPDEFSTAPWSLFINNIFYPGYMTRYNAAKYYLIVSIIVLTITYLIIFVKLKNTFNKNTVMLMALIIVSPNILTSIADGNSSAIINCLIVLIILLHKENPIISGILIGLSMTKPQTTLLIILIMLLEKNFIPVITGAIVDICGWIATSILLRTEPITLLIQFMHNDVGNSEQSFYGIFSFLFKYDISRNTVLLLSAILGIVLTLIGYNCFKSINIENKYIHECIIYTPAILCTQFWTYMWNNDKFMLAIPIIAYLFLMFKTNRKRYIILICILNSTLFIYALVNGLFYIKYSISVLAIIFIYFDFILNTEKRIRFAK